MSDIDTTNQTTTFSRRQVLAGLGAAGIITVVGTSPVAGAMKAFLAPGASNNQVIVNVFLRGGADGLNIVVPYGDPDYYRLRPGIGIQPGALDDLDGFYGLNRAFNPLLSLYRQGQLAFIHAAGSHAPDRSHFTAMDNMDFAFGNTGWMQRVMAAESATDPVNAISIGSRTSPSLRGPVSGMAFPQIRKLLATSNQLAPLRSGLESMYGATDPLLGGATLGAFSSIDVLRGVDTTPDVAYPNNSAARDLREAAALIKADVGVKMVSINAGGWDHHTDELNRMETKGSQLAGALAAFKADLGAASERVMTVVMTEFGRTAEQNGSGGTDHGHGSFMMVMGGNIGAGGGGKVYTAGDQWVGLAPENLDRRRYLEVSTDFRSVLAEVLERHYGFNDLGRPFPGFTPAYAGFLDEGTPPETTTTTAPPTTVGPPTTPSSTVPPESTTTTVPGTSSTSTTLATTTTTMASTTTTIMPPTTAPPPGGRGTVSGAVRYTGGEAAPQVVIDLFEDTGGGQRGTWLGDTRTDASGNYAFDAPAGNYVLTFIAPQGGLFVGGRPWAQPSVTIVGGADTGGIDAELVAGGPQAAAIGGAVTDGGSGVPGLTVDLFMANGDGSRGLWLGDTVTDTAGRYQFSVQPGCYVLTFIAPAERQFANGGGFYQPSLCVDAGQNATDVDAALAT